MMQGLSSFKLWLQYDIHVIRKSFADKKSVVYSEHIIASFFILICPNKI